MLTLLVYFGIGFLGAMVLEWMGVLHGIFDEDVCEVSTRTRVLGKAVSQLILTVYWPIILAYYISMKVDRKKK